MKQNVNILTQPLKKFYYLIVIILNKPSYALTSLDKP